MFGTHGNGAEGADVEVADGEGDVAVYFEASYGPPTIDLMPVPGDGHLYIAAGANRLWQGLPAYRDLRSVVLEQDIGNRPHGDLGVVGQSLGAVIHEHGYATARPIFTRLDFALKGVGTYPQAGTPSHHGLDALDHA